MKLFLTVYVSTSIKLKGDVSMQDERKRILDLVEKGVISATEALDLLEKIEAEKRAAEQPQQPFTTKEKQEKEHASNDKEEPFSFEEEKSEKQQSDKTDQEFIDELKKDFTQFSSKFMDMFTTAVTKVREFDFTGEKRQFTKRYDLGSETIQNVSAKVPNGSFEIVESSTGDAYVEVEVVPTLLVRSEDVEADFEGMFTAENDHGTVRITNHSRTYRTNVTLFLPKKVYQQVTADLSNGHFIVKHFAFDEIKVASLNGKVKIVETTARKMELETSNGTIDVIDSAGNDIEVESTNGSVTVSGAFKKMQGSTVNGAVNLKTTDANAELMKAQTAAGSIDIQVPEAASLSGKLSSNIGQINVQLEDVQHVNSQEQMLSKSARFEKKVDDLEPLEIKAETRAGSIVVRYAL